MVAYHGLEDTTDSALKDTVTAKLRFSFLPRHCSASGESLWFKKAYKVRRTRWSTFFNQGYDEPPEIRWYTPAKYMVMKLRDEL